MSLTVNLLIFGFAFLSAMTILTILSSFKLIENLFFRTLAGGTTGTLSASYLSGITPTLSFLEASANGDFGLGGYFMLVGLFVMLAVWGSNLFQTKEGIVR